VKRALPADAGVGETDPPEAGDTDQEDRACNLHPLSQKGREGAAGQDKLPQIGASRGDRIGKAAGAQVGLAPEWW
jgi:hypothetical protein